MGPQKVSIIITYLNNRAALIVRAVKSVLAQAIDGDEIIVIDDGSSDNTQFLAILSRVWGADSAFLAQHGEAYRQVVRETRCRRIAALLMKYGTREARVEIRLIDKCPWKYLVAAHLPAPLFRILIAIRRIQFRICHTVAQGARCVGALHRARQSLGEWQLRIIEKTR